MHPRPDPIPDYEATQEFYTQGLGMVVDKVQEVGQRMQIVFCYTNVEVGMLFECERTSQQLASRRTNGMLPSSSSSSSPPGAAQQRARAPIAADANMLIYVNELGWVVENLRARDFWIRIDPFEAQPGVRTAVVVDPNGVRITLVESDATRVSKPCAGRIGYLTVPVRDFPVIDKVCSFWEYLSAKPSTSLVSSRSKPPPNPWREPYNATRDLEYRIDERTGFRVVDAEKFVEDLISFCWLANGARTVHPAVCYRHRIERRAASVPQHAGSQLLAAIVQSQQQHDLSQQQVRRGAVWRRQAPPATLEESPYKHLFVFPH